MIFQYSSRPSNLNKVVEISAQRKVYATRGYRKGGRVLLHFQSSIIQYLVCDISLAVNIIILVLFRFYMFEQKYLSLFPITAVTGIWSICSFLLVFYTNQVYSRYTSMFWLCNALQGRMLDICLLIQSSMSVSESFRVYRYLNTAHILGFIGCTKTYTEENLLTPFAEKYKLLTEDELRRIRSIGFRGGSACREVLNWILRDLQELYKQKKISDMDKYIIQDKLTAFRSAFGQIYDYQDNPIPFIYVNFVYWIALLYPGLFAIALALSFSATSFQWPHEFVAFVLVLINASFASGVRIVASKLIEPFGDDQEDFNVYHYIDFITLATLRQLHSTSPPQFNAVDEILLNEGRTNIGSAFEEQALLYKKGLIGGEFSLKSTVA